MTSGGGDLERTLGRLLSLDVLEVGHRRSPGSGVGSGRRKVCNPLKWLMS